MSWIIGYRGKVDAGIAGTLSGLHPVALHKCITDSLYIASGGIAATSHFSSQSENNTGFLLSGIIRDKLTGKILDTPELANIKNLFEYLKTCDGHFVAIQWDTDILHIATDDLGLRELYIARYGEGFIFSTRADWLARLVDCSIDFLEFGSRWLLFNQMSKKSFLTNITRITAGDSVEISGNEIRVTENNWLPESGAEIDFAGFDALLEGSLRPMIDSGKRVTLSLSGGMDSRVLLAYLKSYTGDNWDCHTFGPPELQDRVVAESICRDHTIRHRCIFDAGTSISPDELQDFAGSAAVTQTASAYMQLRNYNSFRNSDELIIDGGFGEIWRREFFGRLLIMHKGDLQKRNAAGIIGGIRSERADIFSDDVNEIMNKGALHQVENLFHNFPDVNSIGVENWLDLVAARVRFHNYFGPEQARLDGFTTCIMPFMQKSLLEKLFRVSLNTKKNGKLFHKIIRKRFPELLHYPLVKGLARHPATLTSWQIRLWLLASRMTQKKKVNIRQVQFLGQYREFLNDTINSSHVRTSGIYNTTKLETIISDFNNNRWGSITQLDWALAFLLYDAAIKSNR